MSRGAIYLGSLIWLCSCQQHNHPGIQPYTPKKKEYRILYNIIISIFNVTWFQRNPKKKNTLMPHKAQNLSHVVYIKLITETVETIFSNHKTVKRNSTFLSICPPRKYALLLKMNWKKINKENVTFRWGCKTGFLTLVVLGLFKEAVL